jgi:hypothetical protein
MRTTLIVTALLLATAAGADERLVLSQAQIDARLATLTTSRELALREKPAVLAERIRALRADSTQDPVRREKLLRDAAEALGKAGRSPAAETALRALAGDEPVVFVLLDEGDHPGQTVPAFDPGAMARYALGSWVRGEARTATLLLFSGDAGTADALTAAFDADGEARLIAAGITDAAKAAEPSALRRNRSALLGALKAGYPVEDAVAIAAIELGDARLATELFATGDPARTVHHLPVLLRALRADEALDLLAGLDRPELASAALQSLAAYAATEPRARTVLLAKLADPRDGGSAAAALAALHDPALAPTLAQLARTAPSTIAAKRAALALFLDGSEAARAALATLGDDPRVGAEARRWLAAGGAASGGPR